MIFTRTIKVSTLAMLVWLFYRWFVVIRPYCKNFVGKWDLAFKVQVCNIGIRQLQNHPVVPSKTLSVIQDQQMHVAPFGFVHFVACKSILPSPKTYLHCPPLKKGARCGTVGWGTVLQAGRSWARFPMVSLEFFIDIILPAALWPWGWLSL